jgi:predicted GNAT superfamily acetyltransferase
VTSHNLVIRDITSIAEMRLAEDLQKDVWGFEDRDVVPFSQLAAAREAGGVLVGAFDGSELAGFVYGFPGFEHGRVTIHSNMAAVRPEFRNQSIGYELKRAQRARALASGIDRITWTFDPLQSVNAYFNFAKLGVVSDRYLINFYGEETSSFLHSMATDRLWVTWNLHAEREERNKLPEGCQTIVECEESQFPREIASDDDVTSVAIEIPLDINTLLRERSQVARQWREVTRNAFTRAINSGFIVAGFVRTDRAGVYCLTRRSM